MLKGLIKKLVIIGGISAVTLGGPGILIKRHLDYSHDYDIFRMMADCKGDRNGGVSHAELYRAFLDIGVKYNPNHPIKPSREEMQRYFSMHPRTYHKVKSEIEKN
jgi:hypothetical protein